MTYGLDLFLDLSLLQLLCKIMCHPLEISPHEYRDNDSHDRKSDDPESVHMGECYLKRGEF